MLRVERPLIAINGELTTGEKPGVALASRYADAVLKAGGVPVVIAPVGGPADIERLLERVDGLLLSGGDDFDTARLGLGPTHPCARPVPTVKQDFDFELARAALEHGVPTLGICYGMQLLALVGGGALYQHLPEDRPGSQRHSGGVHHSVAIEPTARLARLLGIPQLDVVSRHHQAIARVGASWRIAALDAEGLIEAIEHVSHPFAFGVQWHPELAPEGSAHDRLLRSFVHAAGARAARALYSNSEQTIEADV